MFTAFYLKYVGPMFFIVCSVHNNTVTTKLNAIVVEGS